MPLKTHSKLVLEMSGAVVSAGLAIIVMARVVDSVETLELLDKNRFTAPQLA